MSNVRQLTTAKVRNFRNQGGRKSKGLGRSMADVFSSDKRSWIMSRVKGENTKPEIKVRSLVHAMGFRYRLHRKNLPGKPDLVFPRHKKIIFVHGCFWHQHEGCRSAARPTSNITYWNKKLERTIERDKENILSLVQAGWKVLVIWECEISNTDNLLCTLENFFIKSTGHNAEPGAAH